MERDRDRNDEEDRDGEGPDEASVVSQPAGLAVTVVIVAITTSQGKTERNAHQHVDQWAT